MSNLYNDIVSMDTGGDKRPLITKPQARGSSDDRPSKIARVDADVKINPTDNVLDKLFQNKDILSRGTKFALADSAHDFSDVKTEILKPNIDKLRMGIPESSEGPVKDFLSENDVLNSLTDESSFQNMIYNLPDNTNTDVNSVKLVQIKGEVPINYNACTFNIRKETGKNTQPNPVNPSQPLITVDDELFAGKFINNTNLFGNSQACVFMLDFSQYHFFEKLSTGNHVKNKTIYYAVTPEIVNDPAGKPNVNDVKYFSKDNMGVKLTPFLQSNNENIVYTSYKPDNKSYDNYFITKYNFALSPVQQDVSSKANTLYTNLLITSDNANNSISINNSKKENSVTTILGHIKKINKTFKKATSYSDSAETKKIFNFNAKLQQKRGGDWFQILACLDIKNRKFTDLQTRESNIQIDSSAPVYFITHDRIAVAYALLLGVNVIYVDWYGKISIFKNNDDETTGFDPNKMYDTLVNNIKNKYLSGTTQSGGRLALLTNYITNYQSQRLEYIKNINNDIKIKLDSIIERINEVEKLQHDNKFKELLKLYNDNIISELFRKMFNFAYLLVNFPDLSTELKYIQDNKNAIDQPYTLPSLEIIQGVNSNLNLLEFYYNKYKDTNPKDYINNNANKTNIYKSIDIFTHVAKAVEQEEKEKNKFFQERLINITPEQSKTNKVDRFIFLSYISILTNENNRRLFINYKPFIQFFKLSKKIVVNVLNQEQKSLMTSVSNVISRVMRSGRQTPETINANIVLNFIYETLCILNNNADTTHFEEKIESTKSSDSETQYADAPQIMLPISTAETDVELEGANNLLYFLNSNEVNLSNDKQIIHNLSNNLLGPVNDREYDSKDVCEYDRLQILSKLASILLAVPTNHTKELTKLYNNNDENVQLGGRDDSSKSSLSYLSSDNNTQLSSVTDLSIDNATDISSLSEDKKSTSTEKKALSDWTQLKNLMFHPLYPLYIISYAFYFSLGPKYDNFCFIDDYLKFFKIIQNMHSILVTNYLSKKSEHDYIHAYFLGIGLQSMIFAANTNKQIYKSLIQTLKIQENIYSGFAIPCNNLASSFCGTFAYNSDDESFLIRFINNNRFEQFIKATHLQEIMTNPYKHDNKVTSENDISISSIKKTILEFLNTLETDMNLYYDIPDNQDISTSDITTPTNTAPTNTKPTITTPTINTSTINTPVTVTGGKYKRTNKRKKLTHKRKTFKKTKKRTKKNKTKKNKRKRKHKKTIKKRKYKIH